MLPTEVGDGEVDKTRLAYFETPVRIETPIHTL